MSVKTKLQSRLQGEKTRRVEKEREREGEERESEWWRARKRDRSGEKHFRIYIANEHHFTGYHWQPKWLQKTFPCHCWSVLVSVCVHARVSKRGLTEQEHSNKWYFSSLFFMWNNRICGFLLWPHWLKSEVQAFRNTGRKNRARGEWMENSLLKREWEEGYETVMNYVSWRELCESVFECAQKRQP